MTQALEALFWLTTVLAGYAYAGYPALLGLLRAVRRPRPVPVIHVETLPTVTLIVPARNEAGVIREKLENIRALRYPRHLLQVVVASDDSTDATEEIVRSFEREGVRLLELRPRRGKGGALNAAVAEAGGSVLVFSDANSMLSADALTKMAAHFVDDEVGAVSGLLKIRDSSSSAGGKGEGFYWRYETWIKKQESAAGALIGSTGCLHAIRRTLYREIPAGLINDDFFLSMKVLEQGRRVVLEDGAIAYEESAGSLAGEFRRHVRDAAGHFQVVPFVWQALDPRRGFVAFGFLSHRILRWLLPFLLPLWAVAAVALSGAQPYRAACLLLTCYGAVIVVGLVLESRGRPVGPLAIPLYFLAVNAAVLRGFVEFIRGPIAWEPIRADSRREPS